MNARDRQRRRAHKLRKAAESASVPQGMTWRDKRAIAAAAREESLKRFRASALPSGAMLNLLLGAALTKGPRE